MSSRKKINEELSNQKKQRLANTKVFKTKELPKKPISVRLNDRTELIFDLTKDSAKSIEKSIKHYIDYINRPLNKRSLNGNR